MPGTIITCLLLCSALIGVLYLSNKCRRPSRTRRCLIISAWALAGLLGYPLTVSGEEYGRDYRNYRDYNGYSGRDYGSAPALNDARTPSGTTAFEKDLVQSIYANCYRSQRASVANYGVPENLIMDYCSCASKNMVGRLSYEDFKLLEKIQSTGTPPPHELQQKMEFVAMTCRKTSIDKVSSGDSPGDMEAMDQISNQNMQRR